MQKILGFVFLLAVVAYIRFGNTVTDVEYEVKNSYGAPPTQMSNADLVYYVRGVVRIAGADIHRPEGYFTQSLINLPKAGDDRVEGAIVKAMMVGFPTKLDAKKAKLLGLEPEFSFWEENGKWVLLFGLLFLLYAFFWR